MQRISPLADWRWIGDWIGRRAALTPTCQALFDATTKTRYTYADLDRRGNQLANFLRKKLGIEKGDRVAFFLNNRVECLDAFAACGKLGAILVPLNIRLSVPEHREYLSNTTPKVLIFEDAFRDTVQQLRSKISSIKHYLQVDGAPLPRTQMYAEATAQQPAAPPPRPRIEFEEPAMILPTGGTTGLPKGAILSHRLLFWNAVNTIVTWGIGPTDICPIVFPLFHTGGWNVLLIPLIHVGGRFIFWRRFDAKETLQVIQQERCTLIIAVPAMYHMMMTTPEFATTDFSSIRFWLSGGGYCPEPILQAFFRRKQELAMGYGLTEVGPNNFYMPLGASKQKPAAVGLPFFHNEVRIVDDNLRDVHPGDVGELLLRGPHAFSGYWNNPKATQETITPDGWVHTGDLARQDNEGFYYIAGRKKEMFKSGGENVFPQEIERVFAEHPAVDQVAVVSMPDGKWGEVGCAFVVLKAGEKVAEETLLDFLRAKLAHYKVPKKVVFLPTLPLTSAGKIDKRTLQESARKGA
jgi:fatty-acyl-CoA synthase